MQWTEGWRAGWGEVGKAFLKKNFWGPDPRLEVPKEEQFQLPPRREQSAIGSRARGSVYGPTTSPGRLEGWSHVPEQELQPWVGPGLRGIASLLWLRC